MKFLRKLAEFKQIDKSGLVVAAFATLNVVDKDGDITLPGFFGTQEVVMLPAHDWSSVPLGKGTITEAGDKAIAEIKMNLEIPEAKNWHSALMFDLENGKPLQEWSYGFTILPGGSSETSEEGSKARRILRPTPEGGPGCKVHEVSPVLVGAGEDTTTLSVKGLKFCDEVKAVLDAALDLIKRGKSLADLRAKEGRVISTANQGLLSELAGALEQSAKEVRAIVDRKSVDKELIAIYVDYMKRTSGKK